MILHLEDSIRTALDTQTLLTLDGSNIHGHSDGLRSFVLLLAVIFVHGGL
jgi:hypothetical protein